MGIKLKAEGLFNRQLQGHLATIIHLHHIEMSTRVGSELVDRGC
jgi:hypothetical protein